KPLRKGVAQFLNSQDGRTIAMEAVAATLAAVGGKQAVKRSKEHDDTRGGAADPLGAASSMASAFSFAIGEGVRSFTAALQQGKARADARAAWPAAEPDEAQKKSGPMLAEASPNAQH